ncbi:MAG: hypothetical protein E5Y60_32110, partial [Mesorhizobium sp.]
GHGGPAMVANTWLEGSYSEIYPEIGQGEDGLRKLFRQFSFPRGVPSHAAPETPGSIHEGGELGYALVHAFGAAFDNPDLVVACVVGDGEAETGPLAAALVHDNVALLTGAEVLRLDTDASGRTITQAMIRHKGQDVPVRANRFILAAGAVNSAALLLRSANGQHPNGLANGSDQVGRNFMNHNCTAMITLDPRLRN